MTREVVVPLEQGPTRFQFLPGVQVGWLGRAVSWLVGNLSRSEQTALHVEARLSLGPKKSLVLIHCAGRQVLLALSGDAITPVLDLAAEPLAARTSTRGARRGERPAKKGILQ